MELLIKCKCCNGKGTKNRYTHDSKENVDIIEEIICTQCNGKGVTVKKGHYLSFDLLHTRCELNNAWKILKHELIIPSYYFYNSKEECKDCNGYGYIEYKTIDGNKTIIKKETCKTCNGKGIIHTQTIKDIYNEIFQNYLGLKKQRDEIKQALKDKVWEDEKYSLYKEAHPYGYWEVCVRCKKYFDRIENLNVCCGCTNESMCPENGCYYEPVDEKAKKWFVNKGYKKCIGYSPKYKWWRNKYMKR